MIVVLQPRRVAARTVATRGASERDGKLGAEVGIGSVFDYPHQRRDPHLLCHRRHLVRWLQDDRTLANIGRRHLR